MSEVSKERRREWELEETARALQRSMDNEYDEAKRKWENEVGAEIHRRWATTIEDANRKVSEAKAIADAAAVKEAEANGKYKPGTVLVRWENKLRGWDFLDNWKEVGRGVVEVMTPDTEVPKNTGWREPAGTLMVRWLKKDGTPGKVLTKLGHWRHTWLPEGEKPK